MVPSATIAVITAVLTYGPAPVEESSNARLEAVPFPGDGVEVIEQLGTTVPLDVPLRDHTGKDTTLGALIAGDIPTILTFNYSACPNLCSTQLTGLVNALPELAWKVGKQFRIVTIVLDPNESAERARDTRSRYVAKLPPGSDPAGWVFASTRTLGDGAPIKAVADSVGFKAVFLEERAEWAHPAVLIFVSMRGRVTRYVHGVDYTKDVLTQSINRAGTDEPMDASGFLMRCLHWDPTENDYSRFGSSMLRFAAATFLALILAAYGAYHLLRRKRRARALGVRP